MSSAGILGRRIDDRLGRWNLSLATVPIWLVGLFVVVVWAAPFVWMVSTSLKPPEGVMTQQIEWLPRTIVFDNYRKTFEYPVARWAFNSFVVSV
ncbi:MAG: hypothetical protein ACR2RL_25935, partial [Gammaproteobacteria bacterium]